MRFSRSTEREEPEPEPDCIYEDPPPKLRRSNAFVIESENAMDAAMGGEAPRSADLPLSENLADMQLATTTTAAAHIRVVFLPPPCSTFSSSLYARSTQRTLTVRSPALLQPGPTEDVVIVIPDEVD